MPNLRRSSLAVIATLALLSAVSCSSSDDTESGGGGADTEAPAATGGGETTESVGGGGQASGDAVAIADFTFEPGDLTVPAGTEVTWTNEDSAEHTTTGRGDKEWDSGNLAEGDTFSETFDEAGAFDYLCTIHTYMKGTITVE